MSWYLVKVGICLLLILIDIAFYSMGDYYKDDLDRYYLPESHKRLSKKLYIRYYTYGALTSVITLIFLIWGLM